MKILRWEIGYKGYYATVPNTPWCDTVNKIYNATLETLAFMEENALTLEGAIDAFIKTRN